MILLYHAIIPDNSPRERVCIGQALLKSDFERQVRWLASHWSVVSLPEYLTNMRSSAPDRKKIAITFDDGTASTFGCIFPVISERKIPITIFVTTGHLENGEILWFSYLKAICFETQYANIRIGETGFELKTISQRKKAWYWLSHLAKASGNPVEFCKEMSKTYPIYPQLQNLHAGMTFEQVRQAGSHPLFELGAHTVTHPYLPHLTVDYQKYEIEDSNKVLSTLTRKPVRFFAYPGGVYDGTTLDLVKKSGYTSAFAVRSQQLGQPAYEIGRMGIYSPSLLKLQLKMMGIADLVSRFGIKIG